jgi:ATP-dependent RNA helicase RhlE
VGESFNTYGKYVNLRSTVVYGGVKINPQMMKLRGGIDVLVATPGRLLDLYNQNAVKFSQLEVLVLDEADRMLDMGFIDDIRRIIKTLPPQRQNLMFSATFSDEIRKLAKGIVNNPVEISVNPRNTTATTVKQWMIPVDKKQKPALLSFLIKHHDWQQALVFARTKIGANKLTRHLESEGIKADAIHGNKSQSARTKALAEFKNGNTRVLVATDIAARGLDIDQLPQVVNFDLPNVAEDYIHRIGRTGRAGATGQAISLVSADEFKQLSDIERLIKKLLPRKLIDGFEPNHDVPASKLDLRPIRPKKPKKIKPKQSREEQSTQNKGKKAATKTKARNGKRNAITRGTKTQGKRSSKASKVTQGRL